ncbi:PEP-CTERM sorting domain-containing protein [Aeoliella mucimassa]|uniref:PEP-CTERM sorting domain-containing protein n=1 Tax=Aeoliella mucimassa TaxID=2527972 RepID=UPI0018D4D1FA|nr:PEP-CTERM sorting domain-containing protein [Aeoliella mucimassa]
MAATIRLTTGEFRLSNIGETDISLVGYSIEMSTPELLADQWLPVTGRLDSSVTGDGSFDAASPWFVLAPLETPPTLVDELSEATALGSGGLMAAGDILYLGNVWDTNTTPDVAVTVFDGTAAELISVTFVPGGDYNEDGLVDLLDYDLWKSEFGSSGIGLLADGNADGQVDLSDYTVWRDNLGATALSAVPTLAASIVSVPEPAAIVLLAVGSLAVFTARRRYLAG